MTAGPLQALFALYVPFTEPYTEGSVYGPHMRASKGPCHSPKLALLSGGWEGQEQQANVDQDLVGFWADLGADSDSSDRHPTVGALQPPAVP